VVTTEIQFPPGRYGRRRAPGRIRRRWLTAVLLILVIAMGLAIAVKLYRQYGEAPYQVRMISVTNLTDTGVTVTFEVAHPAGEGATCTVRARSRDGSEVGKTIVAVSPADPNTTVTRVTYTLATTAPPVIGEVPGCGPAD